MAEDNIVPGDLVISLAGHDKGKLFLVLQKEEDVVFYADGKVRHINRPKQKKLKHIKFFAELDNKIFKTVISGELSNKKLKKHLNKYL